MLSGETVNKLKFREQEKSIQRIELYQLNAGRKELSPLVLGIALWIITKLGGEGKKQSY